MAQISEPLLAQLEAEFGVAAFQGRAASQPVMAYTAGLADWFALLTNLGRSLPELIERFGGLDTIIATVEAFYDRVIAPIDLPYVPNIIEPRVDAAIRALIGPMLRDAYKRLVGDKQPTVVD